MYITQIKEINNKKKLIMSEGKPIFALYNKELKRFNIEAEKDLDEATIEQIKNEILLKRCFERSLYILKNNDKTKSQLTIKLKDNYYPIEVIDKTLEKLISYGYIDDKRYILNYFNSRSKTKSKKYIINMLMQKGISKEEIISVLAETQEVDEEKIIVNLIKKKEKTYNINENSSKNKMIQFLLRKGFSYEIVSKTINNFNKIN